MNRIVNDRHVARIKALVADSGGRVVLGNPDDIDEKACHIPPIVIDEPNSDSELLKQEIFGPVLPVVAFDDLDEAIQRVNAICEHPLALYVFSESRRNVDKVLRSCTSGGVAVNSALEHFTQPYLPFGGVTESGMGAYHGKAGFEEFSHRRSILYRTTLLPLYPVPPPAKGRFPSFLYGIAVKMFVTGFFPPGVARSLKFVLVALLLFFAKRMVGRRMISS